MGNRREANNKRKQRRGQKAGKDREGGKYNVLLGRSLHRRRGEGESWTVRERLMSAP